MNKQRGKDEKTLKDHKEASSKKPVVLSVSQAIEEVKKFSSAQPAVVNTIVEKLNEFKQLSLLLSLPNKLDEKELKERRKEKESVAAFLRKELSSLTIQKYHQ